MHLILPFASALAEDAQRWLSTSTLPQLSRLLAHLEPDAPDAGDEADLSMPHERALGRALGLSGDDGALPWAAEEMAARGLEPGEQAWGRVTPLHWSVGSHGVVAHDPESLALQADESQALQAALAPLFADAGVELRAAEPLAWYAAHESLAAQPCASLDRVIGRPVEPWLAPLAPRWRRLQNEAQMLLHEHPVNEARAARGLPAVNSFWLSGCGRRQPTRAAPVALETGLRAPALAEDWPAWAAAWQALDRDRFAAWLPRVQAGEPFALTLCGERSAQTWRTRPARRGWLSRLAGGLAPRRPVAPTSWSAAL